MPWSLAPNVITVMGLICVVTIVVVQFSLFGPELEGPLPFWFGIFTAVLYFMNTVFDNMDGKQARRTGAGSPMGMLFDHGTDAMVACMSSMIMSRIM